jgi:hypothetical protein
LLNHSTSNKTKTKEKHISAFSIPIPKTYGILKIEAEKISSKYWKAIFIFSALKKTQAKQVKQNVKPI